MLLQKVLYQCSVSCAKCRGDVVVGWSEEKMKSVLGDTPFLAQVVADKVCLDDGYLEYRKGHVVMGVASSGTSVESCSETSTGGVRRGM